MSTSQTGRVSSSSGTNEAAIVFMGTSVPGGEIRIPVNEYIATDLMFGTEECSKALLEEFPNITILDQRVWEKCVDMKAHNLSTDDFSMTHHQIRDLLKKIDFSQIDGNAGITVGIIPKNLTFNRVVQIATSPKEGEPVELRNVFMERIAHDFGNQGFTMSLLAILTNSTLTGTQNHVSPSGLKERLQQTGWHRPALLPMTAFAVLSYINSKANFYHPNPEAYTFCAERVNGNELVIGRSPATGSAVNISINMHGSLPVMGVGGMLLYQLQKTSK